jgi:hypothetical protein
MECSDPAALNKQLKLLWIGYGDLECGYQAGKASHQKMDEAGVRHVWRKGASGLCAAPF